ncbi:hypothetical protein [Spirosoma pulveris]
MQYPYQVSELVPLSNRVDAEGSTHTVYHLPAPRNGQFSSFPDEQCTVPVYSLQLITNVRVSLFIDETGIPTAVVVPFDEYNQENHKGSVFMDGVTSIVGVLDRLGFTSVLATN